MAAAAPPGGSGGGKRISQKEFTEKAWLAIVAAPDIAKQYSQQVVETEHLFKCLLEQPNGMARRIVSKAGSDPSRLLDKTDAWIKKQPRVSGDYGQVRLFLLIFLQNEKSVAFFQLHDRIR